MKQSMLLLLCLLFIYSFPLAQTTPPTGLHENTPNVVALTSVSIVVKQGEIIESGTVVIRDNHIVAAGTDVTIPPDAVVRKLEGMTVYPAFIDLYSDYGIVDIAAMGTESAHHWNPSVNAERRAIDYFMPNKKTAEKLRKWGFSTVMTYPDEGIFRGTGALTLVFDGDAKKAILGDSQVMSLSFRKSGGEYPSAIMGSIALMRQAFLDAAWYGNAHDVWNRSKGWKKAPETNVSLEALSAHLLEQRPFVFHAQNELDHLRFAKIGKEFGLKRWTVGSGYEYRRLEAVKTAGGKLIVTLNFPEIPDLSANEADLRSLRHWDAAAENPLRLDDYGIDFSLSSAGLTGDKDFLKNLRTAVKRGLEKGTALSALTITPAAWLGKSDILGTVEAGKFANLIITDGCIFEDKTKVYETWVAGKKYVVNAIPEIDIRGVWSVKTDPAGQLETFGLDITGDSIKPKVKIIVNEKKFDVIGPVLDKSMFMLAVKGDSLGVPGIIRLKALAMKGSMAGSGFMGDGSSFTWAARQIKPFEEKEDSTKTDETVMASFPVVYPDGAYGREKLPEQPDAILVKNATIWTSGDDGIIENADMLVKNSKVAKIGTNISPPRGALVIDAEGKHVTPGLIDAHSHLAVYGGINESTHSITSEVRVEDIIDSDTILIYRQMAGGLTSACILHGSANTIGGQNSVIKLRWGALPEELIVEDAKPTLKMALGENVKRSNVTGPPTTRYPRSRMGVEQFIRDSFAAAKDYQREWNDYKSASKKNKELIPPRRDLRLETLVEVLDGERWIHCHSYRQDEIEAMIRVADDMGFTVKVFIHNLEGYKVADLMREHGAMPTVFSDWWAYKFEVYDSIPYNGAILHDRGLMVSFNSDDREIARRMNLEAAKAVKYGNVPSAEALKLVTINSAIQLGIDHRTGSLEKGKDADFVIWSGPPLSTYSICEETWIDGRKYFDLNESKELEKRIAHERNTLIQKALNLKKAK